MTDLRFCLTIDLMKRVKDTLYLLESGTFVNAYAIVRDSGVLIIDTATPGKADGIIRELGSINIKPSDIKAIVITHAHPDHAGSCAALTEKSSAGMYIHKDDFDILLGKTQPPEPPYFLGKIATFISGHFFKFTSPRDPRPLDENSRIAGFEDLEIIHTPGHTPGSMSILDAKDDTLFCGDAINNRGNKLTGPNKFFTNDTEQAWRSIAKIGALPFKTLCPGHGMWISEHVQQKIQDLLSANRPG